MCGAGFSATTNVPPTAEEAEVAWYEPVPRAGMLTTARWFSSSEILFPAPPPVDQLSMSSVKPVGGVHCTAALLFVASVKDVTIISLS